MRAQKTVAALLLTAGLLTGCGQTGPLYFDEDPPADQLPPSKKSVPASVIPQPAPEAPATEPAERKNDSPSGSGGT